MWRVPVVTCVLVAVVAHGFTAQPIQLNYQARLEDSGEPLEGSHTLYFGIYQGGSAAVTSSGVHVYSENAIVDLEDGVANHVIGSGNTTFGALDSNTFAFSGPIFIQVAVDVPGNVVLPRSQTHHTPLAVRALDAPGSLFGVFGGSGIDGDRTVATTQGLGTVRAEFRNLAVNNGVSLTADQGWAYIAVAGTCTIAGTIDASGRGLSGGGGGINNAGGNGRDATGQAVGGARVSVCAAGAAGGGGGSPNFSGGSGGGAEGLGGAGGTGSTGFPGNVYLTTSLLAGGATSGSGRTRTTNFAPLLYYRGANGGGGAGEAGSQGGMGGKGGGVVYIECNELVFTGSINASGLVGGTGTGNSGGGGGGGGGVVLVRARKITTSSGSVLVDGGPGGPGAGTGFSGGAGAPGFWDIVEVH